MVFQKGGFHLFFESRLKLAASKLMRLHKAEACIKLSLHKAETCIKLSPEYIFHIWFSKKGFSNICFFSSQG